MRTSKRSQWLSAALALGLSSGSALAQVPGGETGRVREDSRQDQDVLRIEAGGRIEHQSNVFRLADHVSPVGLFGKDKRADNILFGSLKFIFDREISRQRLYLDASLEPIKYQTYTKLDHLAYGANAKLDWVIGSLFYGDLGVTARQALTSFNTAYGGDKNLQRSNIVFLTAGMRITPNWSVFARGDHTTLDNSFAAIFAAADNRTTGSELGVRFEPGTGTELAFLGRHTRAKYPTAQTIDVNGLPMTPTINDFKQNAALMRLQYRPSEDSRFFGEFGYARRSYDAVPARDFSGPTARLGLDWRPSGGFFLNGEVFRDLASPNILTANYVESTGFRVSPTLVLTGKLSLAGRFSYEKIEWRGDPNAATLGTFRTDDLYAYGATLNYDYSRVVTAWIEARQERRSSNYRDPVTGLDNFKYTNNILGVGVLARF